jgi:SAM-dependent methyltransferase
MEPRCLICNTPLRHTLVDLGASPLCESFLREDQLNQMEPFYPLHVRVCGQCFLVQVPQFVRPEEIFTEYAYFSSYSDSWVEHARRYTEDAIERLGLSETSLVVETASNDGYLLQHFTARGVPVLGIEPARNVAEAAIEKGIPTLVEFFDTDMARSLVSEGRGADLIIGNNVLAQVPDLNDFVEAMRILLKPEGVVTVELPHLMRLIEENQFDTIYHEHFSYFSFLTAREIFEAHGLMLSDVEEIPTHGGSLRLWACHAESPWARPSDRVLELAEREDAAGFRTLTAYSTFREQVEETKRALLSFLVAAKRDGKTIAGYGAPGKGNTLLNYCGIRTDFLDYTVDRNPYKHGLFLPGTHIPIFPPERIAETQPDYVFILPWNLKTEIVEQLSYIRDWGGRCVIPIPVVEVLD